MDLIYTIVREAEGLPEKTIVAFKTLDAAEAFLAELEALEELYEAGRTYRIETLRASI